MARDRRSALRRRRGPLGLARGERGNAILEFALVAPILFSVMFGISEIGRAMYTVQMLTAAAREGARVAAVSAPDVAAVTARVNDLLGPQAITPALIAVDGPDADNLVRVRVESDFRVLSGTVLGGFAGTVRLRASSAMRSEV